MTAISLSSQMAKIGILDDSAIVQIGDVDRIKEEIVAVKCTSVVDHSSDDEKIENTCSHVLANAKFEPPAIIQFSDDECDKPTDETHFSNHHDEKIPNGKEESDFKPPDEELAEKVITAAENIFTDFNLFKNNYLMKYIRRNREGFISVKLLASFRKIKALTKDWKVVAQCLEKSTALELNPEKYKVRRIEPVPKVEETSFGKTILVFNLPLNTTVDVLKDMFSIFGTIVKAEIMCQNSENFNAFHKRCMFFNREVSSKMFGVVEFEKFEDAMAVQEDKNNHLPKESELKVSPLLPRIQSYVMNQSRYRRKRYNRFRGAAAPNHFPENMAQTYCQACRSKFHSQEVHYPERLGKASGMNYYNGREAYWPNTKEQSRYLQTRNGSNVGRATVIQNPRGPDGQIGYQAARLRL